MKRFLIGLILVWPYVIVISDKLVRAEYSLLALSLLTLFVPIAAAAGWWLGLEGVMVPVTMYAIWFAWVMVGLGPERLHFWESAACLSTLLFVAYGFGKWSETHDWLRLARRSDWVVSLRNRIGFLEELQKQLTSAQRDGNQLAVAFLDCDNFRAVNEREGHLSGDRVLKQIAIALGLATWPDIDLAILQKYGWGGSWTGRVGGDEFAVGLDLHYFPDPQVICERVRDKVQEALKERREPVTLSIGYVVVRDATRTAEEVLHLADRAMYVAKQSGPGRIHRGPDVEAPTTPAA